MGVSGGSGGGNLDPAPDSRHGVGTGEQVEALGVGPDLRVAMLTQWYSPEPVLQPGWIARGLQRQGARVSVLTGMPNYPDGQVLPGYSAWCPDAETIDGVRVQRAPLYPNHGTGVAKRFLNYSSWALSSTLFGSRTLRSADVVLVYSSPATAAMGAMINRIMRGVPYVLLIQDVWPDSVLASGLLPGWRGNLARAVINRFVASSYRSAASIVVTSPGMRELLMARGVPQEKVTLIYNWVEEGPLKLAPAPKLRALLGLAPDDFVVMYAGNHGAMQSLRDVVRAFGQIPAEERCHLVLVGSGVEKPLLVNLSADVERVHFLDPLPRAEIEEMMAGADAQLVSLADNALFRVTLPSKLQAALAGGHPVLAHACGDVAHVVREAEAGVSAPTGDQEALINAVRRMRTAGPDKRRQWGANGRAYYEVNMTESVGARQMMHVLRGAGEPQPTKRDKRRLWGNTAL